MPLRDLLKRKSKSKGPDVDAPSSNNNPYGSSVTEKSIVSAHHADGAGDSDLRPPVPIVQIMRSTTHSQELLTAPSFSPTATMAIDPTHQEQQQHSIQHGNGTKSASLPRRSDTLKSEKSYSGSGSGKRLSNLLHLSRRRRADSGGKSSSRELAPFPLRSDGANTDAADGEDSRLSEEQRQAVWEKRATLLVQDTTRPTSIPPSPGLPAGTDEEKKDYGFPATSTSTTTTSTSTNTTHGQDKNWPLPGPAQAPAAIPTSTTGDSTAAKQAAAEAKTDDDIQLAIQLHEAGDLEASTQMFGRLADPHGDNNALAQVLYGLALRHGWGTAPDQDLALQYLTQSARNASHLSSSLGTSAKSPTSSAPAPLNRGELTLAIYELGNCHRNGWGVAKSPALAMQYFETAAELGDTDAMVEVAAAHEKGIKGWRGGRKDKKMAATWYRRAEAAGRKEVGNSWIWKGKYDD